MRRPRYSANVVQVAVAREAAADAPALGVYCGRDNLDSQFVSPAAMRGAVDEDIVAGLTERSGASGCQRAARELFNEGVSGSVFAGRGDDAISV